MKLNKLSPVALATTLALGGMMAVPGIAQAEMSATATVSNFYLWRGQDVSAGAAQMAGSLDYSHDSGIYAGVWASSVWGSDVNGPIGYAGPETDLYVGLAGEIGGLGYNFSIWEYLYNEDNALNGGKYSDSDLSEFVAKVSYAGAGLGVYFGNDAAGNPDYEYVTLDYTYGDFNILYGTWMIDAAAADESSHLTLAYAVTDKFKFTVTKGLQDTPGSAYDEDLLFHVAYSLPIDMKK